MVRISKWSKGVNEYADELLEAFNENYGGQELPVTEARLLNGASSWQEYSWGGCSFIYDGDIAERLATPSEIKSRTRVDGSLNQFANSNEQWLDVQARALQQASRKLVRASQRAA